MGATRTGVFRGVDQIAMVVNDLQAAMKRYVEGYGVGPWYVIKFGPENVQDQTLHGKKQDYSHRLAICQIGNVQFELIESLSDTIYREHLNRHGEGVIHHVKMTVDDHDEAMKFFQSKGIEVLQTGNWEGKSRYANLATEPELGFQVEISVASPGFKMPEPDYWYPADRKMPDSRLRKGG
jgi:methylmalonyl-CoA/ethylmalonyl-CoA epimerase